MPPLASATTPSGGSPTRPGSALTTPRMRTVVPIAAPCATAIVEGSPVGAGVGDGAGAGDGVGDGAWLGDGAGLGDGDGVGVGAGLGEGDGAGSSIRSVESTTNRRYPAVPVPEESRCPSEPATETRLPRTGTNAPALPAKMMRRGPDPSSSVTAGPSVRIVGASTTVPWTRRRRPSSGSTAAPVVAPVASGTGPEASSVGGP